MNLCEEIEQMMWDYHYRTRRRPDTLYMGGAMKAKLIAEDKAQTGNPHGVQMWRGMRVVSLPDFADDFLEVCFKI